jgi:tetratricopeptide (TPR) repeat protein
MPDRAEAEKLSRELLRGWRELEMQRPLAAWAAWKQVLRADPENRAAGEALARLTQARDLPEAARASYRFRPPRPGQRSRWNALIGERDLNDLELARSAFQHLSNSDSEDAPARWNLALCLAWMGRNLEAIEVLDQVVHLDAPSPDAFQQAVDAWTLVAVLRQGAGAETLSDDLDSTLIIEDEGDDRMLELLAAQGVLRHIEAPSVDPATGQSRAFEVDVREWLDRAIPSPNDVQKLGDAPVLLATVLRTHDAIRLTSPRTEGLRIAERILAPRLGGDAGFDRQSRPLPIRLMDAALFTLRLPAGLDPSIRQTILRDAVERYYENLWIAMPQNALLVRDDGALRALEPREAARRAREDPVLRAKLTAVIAFREQLGMRAVAADLYAGYPFDRLRNRLGLALDDPSSVDPTDPSCMSELRLGALDLKGLPRLRLLEVLRSSHALGGAALAAPAARALARMAPESLLDENEPSILTVLYDDASARGDWAEALSWCDTAIHSIASSHTREHGDPNESRLARVHSHRGVALARLGDCDAAEVAFTKAIEASRQQARAALDAAYVFHEVGDDERARGMATIATELGEDASDFEAVEGATELLHYLSEP